MTIVLCIYLISLWCRLILFVGWWLCVLEMYPAAGSTRSVCVDVHHQHDHVVGDLETDRVCVHITQAPMNASISEPPVGCNIEMSYRFHIIIRALVDIHPS